MNEYIERQTYLKPYSRPVSVILFHKYERIFSFIRFWINFSSFLLRFGCFHTAKIVLCVLSNHFKEINLIIWSNLWYEHDNCPSFFSVVSIWAVVSSTIPSLKLSSIFRFSHDLVLSFTTSDCTMSLTLGSISSLTLPLSSSLFPVRFSSWIKSFLEMSNTSL